MSIEKATTGKSSHFLNGEDCQDRTGQRLESDQRSGGVSGDGMLGRATEVTPTKSETKTGVRKLQRTLYRQAKSKPKWKAWSLYGDVCRKEVLEAALRQVIENKGVPGVDGMRVEDLKADASFRKQWLEELEVELRNKTYRPQAVRRVTVKHSSLDPQNHFDQSADQNPFNHALPPNLAPIISELPQSSCGALAVLLPKCRLGIHFF